jgi:TonB family protein
VPKPEIDTRARLIAIQAVGAEIRSLREQVAGDDADPGGKTLSAKPRTDRRCRQPPEPRAVDCAARIATLGGRSMKITGLCAAALVATASASAQTSNDLPLPSTQEYFRLAAEVQLCNGGEPAMLQELEALRNQALDYYRTKQSKEGSDSASASAVRELEENVLPTEALKSAASMKRIAADWAKWCRTIPSLIGYDVARHDLALATIGWPGAKPLDQARAAVAAFDAHATRVSTVALSAPRPPDAVPRPPRVIAVDVSCRPEYPPAAIRARAQGQTVVSMSVDATGHVTQATVVQASGPTREHQMLDTAAADALSHCQIDPARDGAGQPVDGAFAVTYTWKLD